MAEVISQNATISITQEGVDRLLPFSDQTVVKLLKEYTQSYYCLSKSPLTMWTHIRFPSQTMVLLSRDITDFTKEGNSTLNTHSHQLGPYIFRVAKSMNKIEIKEYLQKIYGVRVTRVNTSNMLYITPHIIGKGYRYTRTTTRKEPDWKKAYVFIDPNYHPTNITTQEAKEQLMKD